MTVEPRLRIDVWSDYVCPFCYLELPVLDRLQETFGAELQIHWRAFELRPEPVPTLDPAGHYLRDIWARAVYPMATRRRMTLRLPPVQPRSRRALEAAAHAREQGSFDVMHRALFHGFFEDGRDIGQTDVLLEIAASVGLQVEPLQQALAEGRHTAEVLSDQRLARDLGVSAVPTLLLRTSGAEWREALPLSGALPYEHVFDVVENLRRGEVAAR